MHLRSQVDLSFRIKNQSIEIFDIRPRLDDPLKIVEIPIAKATWVNTQKVWRIFWHRADMRWHRYTPLPKVKTLEEFIDAVEDVEYACFYG